MKTTDRMKNPLSRALVGFAVALAGLAVLISIFYGLGSSVIPLLYSGNDVLDLVIRVGLLVGGAIVMVFMLVHLIVLGICEITKVLGEKLFDH